jgi:cardiolipin synthase
MSIDEATFAPGEQESAAICGQGHLVIAGQQLTLFEHSPPLIESMVADIRAARKRVWLESYIFAADAAGQAIVDALVERAEAGVDVRVMYDAVGCISTPSSLFNRLIAAGAQVHAFHSFAEAFFHFGFLQVLNRRNHRKLLTVDDSIAYFGGMNIVDQTRLITVADAKERHLPISAGWRDVHVRLVGSQAVEVADAMQRLWDYVHRTRRRRRWPRWPIPMMLAARRERISFFDVRPHSKRTRVSRVLVPLLRRAKRDITLSMAYFIPVGRVLRELLRARRRGVKVRVIIPAESDVPAVHCATRHLYAYLLAHDIRIYERKDLMLHSKVMVIDNQWTVVGSCNLDPRSLRWNLEFMAVIRARSMAEAVKRICRHEMRNSRRVTLDHCERRTFWQRLLDRLAWSFRRWL